MPNPAPKKVHKQIRHAFWVELPMKDWTIAELEFMRAHYQKTFEEIERLLHEKRMELKP